MHRTLFFTSVVTVLSLAPALATEVSEAARQEAAVSDDPLSAEELAGVFESRSVRVSSPAENGGEPIEFRYRLLVPRGGRPGERFPLVLFLHGAGERGDDNLAQLQYLPAWLAQPRAREAFPCYVLAPQCRRERMWTDVDWSARESTPQRAAPTTDLTAAIAALEATLTEEPVDADRVLLTGLSMGGYGTWDLAARMPDRFAAILPICGGGDEATAARIASLPVWCFHGDSDGAVPVERSRSMIAALRAAGGDPRYSELPGVGHDSWTPAYRDPAVLEWLFGQRRRADGQ